MNPSEDIEKIVRDRKPNIETGDQLDRSILDESFNVMEKTIQVKTTGSKLNFTGLAVSIAAAAVIIIAISFFAFGPEPDKQVDIPKVTDRQESAIEMLTLSSLNAAYRNGGIEAFEAQCDKAIAILAAPSEKTTMEQFIAKLDDI